MGKAASDALVKSGLTRKEALTTAIARNDGYRHPAYVENKFITLHEGFEEHWTGMLGVLPVIAWFEGNGYAYKNSQYSADMYARANSKDPEDIFKATRSGLADIRKIAIQNISTLKDVEKLATLLGLSFNLDEEIKNITLDALFEMNISKALNALRSAVAKSLKYKDANIPSSLSDVLCVEIFKKEDIAIVLVLIANGVTEIERVEKVVVGSHLEQDASQFAAWAPRDYEPPSHNVDEYEYKKVKLYDFSKLEALVNNPAELQKVFAEERLRSQAKLAAKVVTELKVSLRAFAKTKWIERTAVMEADKNDDVSYSGDTFIDFDTKVITPILEASLSAEIAKDLIEKAVLRIEVQSSERGELRGDGGISVDKEIFYYLLYSISIENAARFVKEELAKQVTPQATVSARTEPRVSTEVVAELVEKVTLEKPHDFSAISGFRAAGVTGSISLAGFAAAAFRYSLQGNFSGFTIAAIAAGVYFAWAAVRYFRMGKAASDALVKSGLTREEARTTTIARSDGYRHPAYVGNKFITLHEGFENHWTGMLGVMPLVSWYFNGRYEKSLYKADMYAKANSKNPGDIFKAAISGFAEVRKIAIQNLSTLNSAEKVVKIFLLSFDRDNEIKEIEMKIISGMTAPDELEKLVKAVVKFPMYEHSSCGKIKLIGIIKELFTRNVGIFKNRSVGWISQLLEEYDRSRMALESRELLFDLLFEINTPEAINSVRSVVARSVRFCGENVPINLAHAICSCILINGDIPIVETIIYKYSIFTETQIGTETVEVEYSGEYIPGGSDAVDLRNEMMSGGTRIKKEERPVYNRAHDFSKLEALVNNPVELQKVIYEKKLPGLIKALGDKSPDVRHTAAKALIEIGKLAVEPLIKALGDGSSNVNYYAYVLAQIRDESSVEPLINVATQLDASTFMEILRFLESVGQANDKRLVGALAKTLGASFYSDKTKDIVLKILFDMKTVEALDKLREAVARSLKFSGEAVPFKIAAPLCGFISSASDLALVNQIISDNVLFETIITTKEELGHWEEVLMGGGHYSSGGTFWEEERTVWVNAPEDKKREVCDFSKLEALVNNPVELQRVFEETRLKLQTKSAAMSAPQAMVSASAEPSVPTEIVAEPAQPGMMVAENVRQLFEIVESALNNNRARIMDAGNEIAAFIAERDGSPAAADPLQMDGEKTTIEVKERIKQVLANVDGAKNIDEKGQIDKDKLALPANVSSAVQNISKAFNQLDEDSVVTSLIALARQAKRENQKLIVGISTDWIASYNDKNSFQHKATNALINDIRALPNALRSMGLDNVELVVEENSSTLASEVSRMAEDSDTKLSNVVIITSSDSINSGIFDKLKGAKEGDRAFLAGMDSKVLAELYKANGELTDRQLDIDIMELLCLTLEVAAGKEPSNTPLVISYDRVNRILILMPSATIVDYQRLRDINKGRREALRAA